MPVGHSLRWRIVLGYSILIIISMGGLSIYLSNLIRSNYQDIYRDNLVSNARLLTEYAIVPIKEEDHPSLVSMVNRYAKALNSRVTIIAMDGHVLADSSTSSEVMVNHLDRPEVRQALTEGVGSQLRYSATLKVTMYYVAVPIKDGNNNIGILRLALPLTLLESYMSRMVGTAVGATIVTGLIALILALLLTRHMITPLVQLTNSVMSMEEGKSREISPVRRNDEIGQLARAFSQQADRLNSRIQELGVERGKLSAVLSQMTDGVLIVDSDGKVILINPASEAIFNTNAEKALGQSLVEVVRQHEIVSLWEKSRTGNSLQTMTIDTSPDRLFLQVISIPLLKALPGSSLILLQDLTRLHRLEIVRRDFVSNVSHELRTPLTSLKLLAETLSESALDDPPAAKHFLSRMEDEIDNLTQLVLELLELSRIESGRIPLSRELIRPGVLINSAIDRMLLQAGRAGLHLYADCPADLPSISADSARIEQVLINLIHNSVKFTPPGGEIIVSGRQKGDNIIFSVKDTGVGISPDEINRIFERFYKADRARSGGGTGLGLTIAKHQVESHGGKIWAESQPGQGSIFSFSFPIAQ